MIRSRTLSVVLVVLLMGVFLAGCSAEPAPVDEPAVADTEEDAAPVGSFDVGLNTLDDGRSRAVGVLGYVELEGGFWALYDTDPGEVPEDAPVVAVVANMGELDVSACTLKGKLVAADGVMSDGVSTRMAGPEIIADDVYEVPPE